MNIYTLITNIQKLVKCFPKPDVSLLPRIQTNFAPSQSSPIRFTSPSNYRKSRLLWQLSSPSLMGDYPFASLALTIDHIQVVNQWNVMAYQATNNRDNPQSRWQEFSSTICRRTHVPDSLISPRNGAASIEVVETRTCQPRGCLFKGFKGGRTSNNLQVTATIVPLMTQGNNKRPLNCGR